MNILDIKVMRGPNYWSVARPKLIVMKLDLEEMEERPTNTLPGFRERIEKVLPSLYDHECSEGHKGGFLFRVEDGTWLGHVIEHVALELQRLAGMKVNFGKTRSTSIKGVYHVVIAYTEERAGIYAAKAAVRLIEDLISEPDDRIVINRMEDDIFELQQIAEREHPGPSTGSIIDEARRRGIPYFSSQNLHLLGYGIYQRRIQAALTNYTSSIGVEIAGDKDWTKEVLSAAAIPVPMGTVAYDEEDLKLAVERYGYPLVIKPLGGNQGKGANIDIRNWERAIESLKSAQQYSKAVIVERMLTGTDFRMLVVDGKFIAAAERTPAAIKGDGTSTIAQLIGQVNSDPRRGSGHSKTLTKIVVDEASLTILQERNLTIDSILPAGETLFLKMTANLSTGGTARDVTDMVHPDNILMAERIAKAVGLDICGIDIIATDLSTSLYQNGGAVLEVNAAPGLRMHLDPTEGTPRNVAEPIIDMLFPPGTPSRIPIIAITGTNGKTTTSRLISHICNAAGKKVGFTTTDGIYIQGRMVRKGDCTGPGSTELVLKDPTVDFAVLECARGGIVREGLAFDSCDIAIVTNISADHIGLGDIETLEQMAELKAVVPETVHRDGYAILNADDDLVYKMAESLRCKIAYFSMNPDNERIRRHIADGGIAVVAEDGYVVIYEGEKRTMVEKIVDIPITFSGNALFMVMNTLPATLACYLSGFTLDVISEALRSFVPSPTATPGRMNMFQFKNFQVMVDYAHNPAGLRAIGEFLQRVEAKPKIGIIAGVGDRRDEDILELGAMAAGIFDEIILRQDKDLRGRDDHEANRLIMQGIHSVMPSKKVTDIPEEFEAIIYALHHAPQGAFITICCEDIQGTIQLLDQYKAQEEHTDDLINHAFDESSVKS